MFVRSEAKKVRAKKELERKEEDGVIEVVGGEATDISEDQVEKKKSVMASTEKPKERNTEAEHEEASRKARVQEEREDGAIRQCNEGKWEFRLMDEILDVILEVDLPRFLDSSLVDVDVYPSYVSIVAKNKVLRLKFPELVHSDAGMAERSKITRTLRLTLPKAHVTPTQQLRAQLYCGEQDKKLEKDRSTNKMKTSKTTRTITRQSKISDELLEAAKKVPTDKHVQ
ncbi:hypothetical protein PF005_g23719 [Phytophthora fragariae]|uniref:Dynein axonemal assembly factor 11-like CS domain-containing protein n=1 Tax=Phytophthora fragariae TaxID=53985 RepID=A0A6A3X9N2_9STRA|nr:hypothetical protein PF009_g24694 [Phytophthora fragariae]KAE8980924.1 hypothetical protein PF011_g22235 [Phytophthora fragariae]KAE9078086.1 hypothetical protein PF010_g23263 [Phytophthora fragariae]KAE9084255.1 hypothetical protein PF007_g21584 [Phytophthora fragariae]KAE9109883.1 hypothetical protein PF006_g20571 [Phytophthora fragariae]